MNLPCRIALVGSFALAAVLALAGCGSDKYNEPYKDARRVATNGSGAETGTMPDGFSNYATKCDRRGIRVYVLYHQDSAYGSISTIADPSCK